MKNFDYIVNKEYELLVMDSDFIRNKIMADCDISDEDIQKYYLLKDISYLEPKVIFNREKHDLYDIDFYIRKNQDTLDTLFKKGLISNPDNIGIKKIIDIKLNEEPITAENKLFRDKSKYVYENLTLEKYIKELSILKEDYYNSEKLKETDYLNRAMESSFIVLNKTIDGEYQLIDGFYRLLFKQLRRNVIVKVYYDLNDSEWMQLMITYNAWKIENNNKFKFFDRGFTLGLKSRFNIDLDTYISYRPNKNIIKELHFYVNCLNSNNLYNLLINNKKKSKNYEEVWNLKSKLEKNTDYKDMLSLKYFISDFKILGDIFNYIPESFPDIIINDFKKEFNFAYNHFIDNLITAICCVRILYRDNKQQKLKIDIIDELLNNKEINTSLKKALTMSVEGNIKNRVDSLFIQLFEITKSKLVVE